jgi:LmbE family N-acetylglucosaminyl deacetylase
MTKPVSIRGTRYPSATAAARALGVTPQTVCNARKIGTLDNVGQGREALAAHTRGTGRANKPVTLGGVEHESHKAAAAALGVHPSDIGGYLRTLAALGRAAGK